MAINEIISHGRKFRKCIDTTPGNKKWLRYSFWTKASDVEFNDGTTAESKLGSYKGVTTNENQTAGFAADITLVKSIKTAFDTAISSLQQTSTNVSNLLNTTINRFGGMRFYEDSTGKYVVGADSVPKKLGDTYNRKYLFFSKNGDIPWYSGGVGAEYETVGNSHTYNLGTGYEEVIVSILNAVPVTYGFDGDVMPNNSISCGYNASNGQINVNYGKYLYAGGGHCAKVIVMFR